MSAYTYDSIALLLLYIYITSNGGQNKNYTNETAMKNKHALKLRLHHSTMFVAYQRSGYRILDKDSDKILQTHVHIIYTIGLLFQFWNLSLTTLNYATVIY